MTMRRLTLFAILCVLVPTGALAEPYDVPPDRAYAVRILYKLTRGAYNILAGPMEIPYNMVKEPQMVGLSGGDWHDESLGIFAGFGTGVGYALLEDSLRRAAIRGRGPLLAAAVGLVVPGHVPASVGVSLEQRARAVVAACAFLRGH